MPELTKAQDDVLRFIAASVPPPTAREICRRFGYASTNAAYTHIASLREKRMLQPKHESPRTRGLVLTSKGWSHLEQSLPKDDRICREFLRGDSVEVVAISIGCTEDEVENALRRNLDFVKKQLAEAPHG